MNMLMALAVSIGVLIALWVKFGAMVAPGLAIAVPRAIIAWACFYAAGVRCKGSRKRSRPTSRVSCGCYSRTWSLARPACRALAWIVIGVVAFCIVMQSKVAALSFIPGGFAGAAVTAASGAGGDIQGQLDGRGGADRGGSAGYISEMVG